MLIIHHHLLPSPRHSHTSSISSFFIGKLGKEMKRRNPVATEHEDGDEELLARETEKAMVFLDVLVNYGCRRWLHKEDYTFE